MPLDVNDLREPDDLPELEIDVDPTPSPATSAMPC